MLLLSYRNTQHLPDLAASALTVVTETRLLSLREHLGGITQMFPHRDIDMWEHV